MMGFGLHTWFCFNVFPNHLANLLTQNNSMKIKTTYYITILFPTYHVVLHACKLNHTLH